MLRRYVIPFPTSDPTVVKLTHVTAAPTNNEFEYAHYLEVKGLFRLLMVLLFGAYLYVFAKFSMSRRWLLSRMKTCVAATTQHTPVRVTPCVTCTAAATAPRPLHASERRSA